MVPGHDFGTLSYVNEKCTDGRENNSRIIQNLSDPGLKMEETFFTNFYPGLRDDTTHADMKMTKLVVKRNSENKNFCLAFFKTLLELINPQLVICLGKEVGRYLPGLFKKLTEPGRLILPLYADQTHTDYIVNTDDKIYGKRTYNFIPHPS